MAKEPTLVGVQLAIMAASSFASTWNGNTNEADIESHELEEASTKRPVKSTAELPRFDTATLPVCEEPTGTSPRSMTERLFSNSNIGATAYQSSCATVTGRTVNEVVNCNSKECANGRSGTSDKRTSCLPSELGARVKPPGLSDTVAVSE